MQMRDVNLAPQLKANNLLECLLPSELALESGDRVDGQWTDNARRDRTHVGRSREKNVLVLPYRNTSN